MKRDVPLAAIDPRAASIESATYYPWFDWLRAVCASAVVLHHAGALEFWPQSGQLRGDGVLRPERLADRRDPPRHEARGIATLLFQPRGADLDSVLPGSRAVARTLGPARAGHGEMAGDRRLPAHFRLQPIWHAAVGRVRQCHAPEGHVLQLLERQRRGAVLSLCPRLPPCSAPVTSGARQRSGA